MQLDSDGFVTRAAALADGFTDNDLARARRQGKLRRVASGVYVPADAFDGLSPADQHVTRARAAARNRRGSVVSHQSAAAVHGLDLWDTDLHRVHLSIPGPTGGGRSAGLHLHGQPAIEKGARDRIPVTTLSRTVLDCARTLDFEHAVVIGDSALRANRALDLSLDGLSGRSGIGAARRAVDFMDGRSESPGESLSRIRFRQFGIPAPTLQYVIPGTTWRVDFCWDRRIVGEFDGMAKYGGRPESLAEEKAREDGIRDRGLEVIRWTWRDLFDFDRVVRKYEQALKRSARR